MASRIVFTEGGKGGVAKTEVALSLVSWYQEKLVPVSLLDFDVENTNKSSLQNFYPQAQKLDVHQEGNLDEFFEACRKEGVVLADMGAGAGQPTYRWFDAAYEDASSLDLAFTAIGVTTNDPGAVKSVLKWADHLQERVDYVVVLNEMGEPPGTEFEYWNDDSGVGDFVEAFQPGIIRMSARVPEFQSELRNQAATLRQVVEGKVKKASFLKKMKNVMRAKRYERELFTGFDAVAEKLLPPA